MADTDLPDRLVKPATQGLIQDLGLLLLRLGSGGLMLMHGWPKLMGYSEKAAKFSDPLGIGSPASLALAIFAEVFCAILIMAGLTTRLAALVLTINFAVIVQLVHGADPVKEKELAVFYLVIYAALLLTGPGKLSFDRLIKRLIDRGGKAESKAEAKAKLQEAQPQA